MSSSEMFVILNELDCELVWKVSNRQNPAIQNTGQWESTSVPSAYHTKPCFAGQMSQVRFPHGTEITNSEAGFYGCP